MSVVIGPDTQVTLHFAIRLNEYQVVDSTFERDPATFTFGDGNLLPGFESVLKGLTAGAKETFTISPEQGFGMPNPANRQWIPRKDFDSSMELQEGLMISFSDAANTELPGVVNKVEEDRVEIDFNHPLAGQELFFDVEIIAVEATQDVDALFDKLAQETQ